MKSEGHVKQLISKLGLIDHPEGGYYKETYRSDDSIKTPNGERNVCTVIYFLLTSTHVSKFHKIQSDEHWFWHEGSPLTIHILDDGKHHQLSLGPINSTDSSPQHIVRAEKIFGSSVDEPNSYALVSCVVAPGFDFEDFELFTEDQLVGLYPNSLEIIKRLT